MITTIFIQKICNLEQISFILKNVCAFFIYIFSHNVTVTKYEIFTIYRCLYIFEWSFLINKTNYFYLFNYICKHHLSLKNHFSIIKVKINK